MAHGADYLACFLLVLLCCLLTADSEFGVRFLRWMPAATAHGTTRHHASGLRAARAQRAVPSAKISALPVSQSNPTWRAQ
jgi:hypothetical protein